MDTPPEANSIPNGTDPDVYETPYKMRRLGEDGLNTVVTIPPLVLAKEARKHGMTPEDFIKKFRVVAVFNGFPGVLYRFEPIPDKEPTGNHDKEG